MVTATDGRSNGGRTLVEKTTKIRSSFTLEEEDRSSSGPTKADTADQKLSSLGGLTEADAVQRLSPLSDDLFDDLFGEEEGERGEKNGQLFPCLASPNQKIHPFNTECPRKRHCAFCNCTKCFVHKF